jgi:hypothetical protein
VAGGLSGWRPVWLEACVAGGLCGGDAGPGTTSGPNATAAPWTNVSEIVKIRPQTTAHRRPPTGSLRAVSALLCYALTIQAGLGISWERS